MSVPAIRSVAINCTLRKSPASSSTDRLIDEVGAELAKHSVEVGETIRIVDFEVAAGVSADEGGGDQWPDVRSRILESEILIFGTPIWLGHPSSVAQQVLERLDAFLSETDEQGRLVTFGRVAIVAVVGNEDGAHNVVAQLAQGLVDVGFTIPASGSTYWVGEAMGSVDYRDLSDPPAGTAASTATAAVNAAHLAALLRQDPYRPVA